LLQHQLQTGLPYANSSITDKTKSEIISNINRGC